VPWPFSGPGPPHSSNFVLDPAAFFMVIENNNQFLVSDEKSEQGHIP
jgi:hypothetical protein